MSGSKVIIPKGILNLDKNIVKAVESGITDCTDDLLRVASLRTPVDSTTLEKSGTSKVEKKSGSFVGAVSFEARSKGYNYAKKLNDSNYNLGAKSKSKSARGIRSKFTKSSMKVGKGYLTDTAEKCQEGYAEHINNKIHGTLAKDGFKVKSK